MIFPDLIAIEGWYFLRGGIAFLLPPDTTMREVTYFLRRWPR